MHSFIAIGCYLTSQESVTCEVNGVLLNQGTNESRKQSYRRKVSQLSTRAVTELSTQATIKGSLSEGSNRGIGKLSDPGEKTGVVTYILHHQ